MRIVLFYHSLLSDWNHGNAHFLRGVVTALLEQGHSVRVYEPNDNWSLQNLRAEAGGEAALRGFEVAYPDLQSTAYDLETLSLDEVLGNAELVLVHEWNDHALVRRIGEHRRARGGYRLLFHDTHHRSVTDRAGMAAYDLSLYDGALCFGTVIRDLYLTEGWTKQAWTWHEAADARVFHPLPDTGKDGDLVWIGNWGDNERTAELHEFLLEPVKALGLRAKVYGVRYPRHALRALAEAGIEYGGWLPNFQAPEVFARYRVTVHVPRGPYVRALPGIPTIRVFEALACGIPLVSAPWNDAEGLFSVGEDFLMVQNGDEMTCALRSLLSDPVRAQQIARHGLDTILQRHTCAHRAHELTAIYDELGPAS